MCCFVFQFCLNNYGFSFIFINIVEVLLFLLGLLLFLITFLSLCCSFPLFSLLQFNWHYTVVILLSPIFRSFAFIFGVHWLSLQFVSELSESIVLQFNSKRNQHAHRITNARKRKFANSVRSASIALTPLHTFSLNYLFFLSHHNHSLQLYIGHAIRSEGTMNKVTHTHTVRQKQHRINQQLDFRAK